LLENSESSEAGESMDMNIPDEMEGNTEPETGGDAGSPAAGNSQEGF